MDCYNYDNLNGTFDSDIWVITTNLTFLPENLIILRKNLMVFIGTFDDLDFFFNQRFLMAQSVIKKLKPFKKNEDFLWRTE